jgi:tRNA(Arg) A34 adenosine deaminase TadA
MIASILIVLICSIPLCAGFSAVTHWQWHVTSARQEIDGKLRDKLSRLGLRALQSGDVPAASIVVYGSRTLGTGFDTVVADTNAAGHAEINALSSAMRRVGPKAFAALNRDSLVLITTCEPCPMCRGAILECGIHRVIFLKGRPLMDRMREDVNALLYEWRRTQRGPSSLQDALLRRHPDPPSSRRRLRS